MNIGKKPRLTITPIIEPEGDVIKIHWKTEEAKYMKIIDRDFGMTYTFSTPIDEDSIFIVKIIKKAIRNLKAFRNFNSFLILKSKENSILDLYAKLSIYFSLKEKKRAKIRKYLPLPKSAVEFSKDDLEYLYMILESYLAHPMSVEEAISQLNSSRNKLPEKVIDAAIEILNWPLESHAHELGEK